MVRTEVKISMKKKYSACLFKLLKSYPKNTYTTKKKKKIIIKNKGRRS